MDQNLLYGPCPCGSGKKFKFCCYAKYRDEFESDMTRSEIIGLVRGHAAGVIEIEDENPRAMAIYDEGYEALVDHDFEKARTLLRQAHELQPTLFMAWNNEATAAWNIGDFKAAYDIQKEGNACSRTLNVWGLASLVLYARALGKDEEAKEALDCVIKEVPISKFVAERVCHALILDRRHRDILDYLARSQMDDEPRLKFYAAVAHCNLGEFDAALPLMRAATDSLYSKMAKFYVKSLEEEIPPLSVYKDDWPYMDWSCFPPARQLDKAIQEEVKNPLSVAGGLAIEAIEVLVSDGFRKAEEMLPLTEGHENDPRWTKLIEGLKGVAEDDAKVESGELPPVGSESQPGGVYSEPDHNALFPGFNEWHLTLDISDDTTLEKDVKRVIKDLLQPYAERYWKKIGGECDIVLLEQHLDKDGKCLLECPSALSGQLSQVWKMFQRMLTDYMEVVDYGKLHFIVSHDMMYGGPLLTAIGSGETTVFSIAMPDRFGKDRR